MWISAPRIPQPTWLNLSRELRELKSTHLQVPKLEKTAVGTVIFGEIIAVS